MTRITLILDTNVLWNLDLCKRLSARIEAGQFRVYIPTLVHAERLRQVADTRGENFAIDVVRQFIADARFQLLPLTTEQAETVAEIWLQLKRNRASEDYWKANRFDIVLCAIARSSGHTLVTDEKGEHFAVISDRMNMAELEALLEIG